MSLRHPKYHLNQFIGKFIYTTADNLYKIKLIQGQIQLPQLRSYRQLHIITSVASSASRAWDIPQRTTSDGKSYEDFYRY